MSQEGQRLVYDSWLGEILGRPVYGLVLNGPGPAEELFQAEELDRRLREVQGSPVFIYAKVPTTALEAAGYLESREFRLIDAALVFGKAVCGEALPTGGCEVRSATHEDRAPVVELARSGFAYSRFHLDAAIRRMTADTIKARWAENYFLGKRGQAMDVAVVEGTVVGFCLLLHGRDGVMTIDLIAVSEEHRGRGIAGDMIASAESQGCAFSEIRVGTQLANRPSVRCYERLGFRLHESQYVFHYHRSAGDGA